MVSALDERRTLSLNVFLNTLEEGCKNERRYCFILGAGASKTSGIPTGEELAKQWHGEILEQCSKEEIKELKKRLGVRSTKPSSRAYFDLYAMRFFPDYQNGSAFLERTLERAQPSLGYYPLAALLANTRNNLVITTNFDSLVEDALFIYTDKRPIVISHELLAQYINFNTSRPIIAKLHRGLFFDPLNRAEQVNGLSKQWKDILREAFKRYTPVVIGYAGGDHSLMDFLKETECLSGLYWCYRHDEPPEEIQKVVERHSGYFIPIEGFDEMMYLMGQRFGYTDPCEHIESAAEQRVRDYQEQVKAFQEKLRAAETPSETQSAILRAMDAKQREELQRLDRRIELDEEDGEAYWERGKLYYFANDYAQALEDFTKAKELGMEDSKLYWYKGFCYRRLGETELAIREYSRSLELKETSEVYRNRGLCFTTVKLYDKAVLDFTRAIKLPPGDKRLYRERGSAYQALEEYKKAQADYEKALELEPADAELYTTLGDVQERLGEVQEALQSYQKAIQIDPNYARAYNNRGVVYLSQMETEKALADHRKAVKLAGDRALYHVNVGIVLNRLERYSEAVTSCNKAIKLDPGYAKAYDIRADAYEGLEQTEKAERDWETYRSRKKRRTRRRHSLRRVLLRGRALQPRRRGGACPRPGGRCGQKINCLEGASGATLVGGYTGREKIQACRGGCPHPPAGGHKGRPYRVCAAASRPARRCGTAKYGLWA